MSLRLLAKATKTLGPKTKQDPALALRLRAGLNRSHLGQSHVFADCSWTCSAHDQTDALACMYYAVSL